MFLSLFTSLPLSICLALLSAQLFRVFASDIGPDTMIKDLANMQKKQKHTKSDLQMELKPQRGSGRVTKVSALYELAN